MAPMFRPQALLRALNELGREGLQLGGRNPPPSGPSWQGKAGHAFRQQHHVNRLQAQQQQYARFSSTAQRRSAAAAAQTSKAISQNGWAVLRGILEDAFAVVFRGVRRESPVSSDMAQLFRHWSREAQNGTVKKQHGFYKSMQARASHPFQSTVRMTRQLRQPVQATGLQTARNFSSGPSAGLLFQVPFAIRAFANEVEDEAKKSNVKQRQTIATQQPRKAKGTLRSPRRAGSHCTIPFKRLIVNTEVEANKPESSRMATTASSASHVISEECIVPPSPSVVSHGDFDYYFSSPRHFSTHDDEKVTTVLCVPLDPDLTTLFSKHRQERQQDALFSSASSPSLVDGAYVGHVEQIHASYEYHALRYIVPLEHALDLPVWRRHLPRDWDMNLLVISAIDGVQRGDHCLEIRFQGTPAHVIERLLLETMGESRARWYMAFLSEERYEGAESEPEEVDAAEDEPSLAQMLSPLIPAPSLPSDPESPIDSSAIDLVDEISSMGAASRLSFDELGAGAHHDARRSAISLHSVRDDDMLQFPTLAIARAEHRPEHGFASAFLSRYSDNFDS